MKFFRNIWLKSYTYVLSKKIEIAKAVLLAVALLLVSFLLEYFGFGRHFNQYRFAFILAILSLITFFVALRKKIGEKPEIGFLAVALICGTLLSFSEPAYYVSWDEQIHYKHAEKLSSAVVHGMFSRPNTTPFSYSIDEQKQNDIAVDAKYKKPLTKSSNGKPLYTQLAYVPSIVALIVGAVVHMPFHLIFVFGRWMNLFFFAIIVFFAIRKLKTGKMLMSVIALLPTSIFLASNYNHDSWLTAFMMLGLAYLFSELQEPDKKISVRSMVVMIGAFILGLGAKEIYFPFLLLLFLLPQAKFASSKQYKKFIFAIILSLLFIAGDMFLPFLIKGPQDGGQRGGSEINSAQQVKFILSEPIAYTKILFNFSAKYVGFENSQGFMTSFAYLGSMSGFLLLLMTLGVVTFTDRNEYDAMTSGWKVRFSVVLAYLATVVLICTGLYVSFTPVRSLDINGVQARYLIPLVFPLLFILGSSHIKNKINKNIYNTVIFGIMSAVLLSGIWSLIISRYY